MSQAPKGFNVFLSYNSRDRETVEAIAKGLRDQGLEVFFDLWCLPVGHPFPERIEQALTSCNGVVVFFGRQTLGPWQVKEVNLALERQTRERSFPVVPVLLPEADPPLSFLGLNTWIDWRDNVDGMALAGLTSKIVDALHWREESRRRKRRRFQRREAQPLDASPYRGLLPFREEDASLYFGRESFIQSLRATVEGNSLVALVGPSGSGKSSLVHAGLLPELRSQAGFWQSISVRPGPHPISSLASGFVRLLEPGKTSEEQKAAADRLTMALMERKESLESLSVRAHKEANREGLLLLIVDQWEELYTLAQEDKAERERFIEEILAATRTNSISTLLLFRGDFYSQVMEQSEIRRRLQGDCLIPIPEMSPADLRKAVEKPAEKVRLSFDEGLVDEILRDVERQPGQLPLLQYVLAQLWWERDKERGKLLSSSYAAMGRLEGALARKADEITRELPETEVRRLFLRLVRVEKDAPATRRRAPLDELDQESQRVASCFVQNRLLVTGWDALSGNEILEIAHEALFHHWRRLSVWIEENKAFLIWRDLLEHDLEVWLEKGQKESFLLTAGPLQEAELWFKKRSGDLSAEAYGYVQLGLEKRKREQRRGRLLRFTGVIVALLLFGLGYRILYLRAAQARARSAALAAEAARLSDRKLDLALLLAVQAGKVMPTAEARGVTLSLTAGNPALRHFLHQPGQRLQGQNEEDPPEDILAVAFGPGDLIATGGKGRVFLWDAQTGHLRRSLFEEEKQPQEQVVSLAFSPDGSLLASGGEEGRFIHLWSFREDRELDSIPTDGATQYLTFGPEERLAWSTPSGIYVWDVARRVPLGHLPKPNPLEKGNFVSGLAFGPSGQLAVSTAGGGIAIWDVREGQPPRALSASGGDPVMGIAFAPDGSLLAAGNSLRKWDLGFGKPLGHPCDLLSGTKDTVISVAFSQDRRFVASTHLDRRIRLWSIAGEGCSLFTTLSGHSGLIWTLAFGAERKNHRLALISGGEEGDLILWEADPQAPTFSLPLEMQPLGPATLAVSHEGGLVAVGDSSGEVALYDGSTRKRLARRTGGSPVLRMAFREDGRVLATGDAEGNVLLWDVARRDLGAVRLLKGTAGKDPVRSLAFSEDHSWVVAGTKSGRLIVWKPDVRTTAAWSPQKLYQGPILALAFLKKSGPLSEVMSLFGGEQKEYLVIGGPDGSLSLWDLERRMRVHEIESAHSKTITSLAVRHDGLLASGSLDRSVRLWRLNGDFEAQDTLFLGWRITDLDLSTHGELLAAAGEEGADNEILLWDLKARTPFGNGFPAPGLIRRVNFIPGGRALYIGGTGVAAWWDLRPKTWSDRACDMVRRSFDPIERETYLKASENPEICVGNM